MVRVDAAATMAGTKAEDVKMVSEDGLKVLDESEHGRIFLVDNSGSIMSLLFSGLTNLILILSDSPSSCCSLFVTMQVAKAGGGSGILKVELFTRQIFLIMAVPKRPEYSVSGFLGLYVLYS